MQLWQMLSIKICFQLCFIWPGWYFINLWTRTFKDRIGMSELARAFISTSCTQISHVLTHTHTQVSININRTTHNYMNTQTHKHMCIQTHMDTHTLLPPTCPWNSGFGSTLLGPQSNRGSIRQLLRNWESAEVNLWFIQS